MSNSFSFIRIREPLSLFLALFIWCIASTCLAQEAIKIEANDGELFDEFSSDVALHGNRMLIGARNDAENDIRTGSVYVYELTNGVWSQAAKLRANDIEEGDDFGNKVALFDNIAVIGASGDDDQGPGSGSVYIFEYTDGAWTQTAKLLDPNAGVFSYGNGIATDGSTVFVKGGSISSTPISGTVYIYEKVGGTWTQIGQIRASTENTSFGTSLSIDGRRALIGASEEAFIFEQDRAGNWHEVLRMEPNNEDFFDGFGRAVHLDGKYAIIGAPFDDDVAIGAGAAYIYEVRKGGAVEVAKLTQGPDGNQTRNLMGSSVSMNQGKVVVGVPDISFDKTLGEATGAVFIFEKTQDGWTQTDVLTASDAITWYRFGDVISMDGDHLLVGTAPIGCQGIQGCEGHPGAAYYYDLSLSSRGSAARPAIAELHKDMSVLPENIVLHNNYPNPFNPVTTIRFDLNETEHVRLSVYNMLGQKVRTLVDGIIQPGNHTYSFNAEGLPSGSYLYLLETSKTRQSQVMLLLE